MCNDFDEFERRESLAQHTADNSDVDDMRWRIHTFHALGTMNSIRPRNSIGRRARTSAFAVESRRKNAITETQI